MIYLVIYSVMLMLAGILAWDTIKYLWNQLTQYRLKKECNKYEDKQWEKETKTDFKRLKEAWKKAEKQKEIKEIFERLKKEYEEAKKEKEAD